MHIRSIVTAFNCGHKIHRMCYRCISSYAPPRPNEQTKKPGALRYLASFLVTWPCGLSRRWDDEERLLCRLVGAGGELACLPLRALALGRDGHLERTAEDLDRTGLIVHREVNAAFEDHDTVADGERGPGVVIGRGADGAHGDGGMRRRLGCRALGFRRRNGLGRR